MNVKKDTQEEAEFRAAVRSNPDETFDTNLSYQRIVEIRDEERDRRNMRRPETGRLAVLESRVALLSSRLESHNERLNENAERIQQKRETDLTIYGERLVSWADRVTALEKKTE